MKSWDFAFFNVHRAQSSDHFLGGVQLEVGLPGVGNSPVRKISLAAGSAKAQGSLSGHGQPESHL